MPDELTSKQANALVGIAGRGAGDGRLVELNAGLRWRYR